MSKRMALTWVAFAVTFVAAPGCSAIVGAECAEGLSFCGRCVNLSSDSVNCGACGNTCGVGVACVGGVCGGAFDAGPDAARLDGGDAGVGLDGAVDLDAGDATVDRDGAISLDGGDGGVADGAVPPGCGLGRLDCAGVCVDALTDPANCGDCGVMCGAGEVCAGGACAAGCLAPRMSCAGRCIDVSSDADNCGSCGTVCSSGICIDGDCSDPLAGHVVVVGHDYDRSRTGMNRIAGNAVFLARGNPVRVLVWEGMSSAASRAGTDAAITQVASALGRSWVRLTPADAGKVPLFLADADAFVIYAQNGSDDASLRALGTLWSSALAEFLRRGSSVVVFETMTGAHAGTWQILAEAGLFTCTGRVDTTGSTVRIASPSDAVALRVPLAYSAERTTVRFMTTDVAIVADDSMGPVVVHHTVVP